MPEPNQSMDMVKSNLTLKMNVRIGSPLWHSKEKYLMGC